MNDKREVKNFFSKLEFNALQHLYKVDNKAFTSVSNVVNSFVEKVDFNKVAYFVAKKTGKKVEEILNSWEEIKNVSCELGTKVHLFAEKHVEQVQTPTSGYEEAVVKFWEELPEHILPFLFEFKMYSEEFRIAGTCDVVLFDTTTKEYILIDYKTNKDLFKNYKSKTLLFPFTNLIDSPFNKYQIQLSLYKILFELTGKIVKNTKILWLKEDGNYLLYNTKDYTQILKQTLWKTTQE